jgi:hypothetical protein
MRCGLGLYVVRMAFISSLAYDPMRLTYAMGFFFLRC